ncbi:MAG: hypothetical protein DME19_19360, partial [Verrucomicrobia bacterium]
MLMRSRFAPMKPAQFAFWFALCSFSSLLATEAATLKSRSISPEYFAVLRGGDVLKLREALDRGASPNARDATGNTPLMLASVYGGLASMRLLI